MNRTRSRLLGSACFGVVLLGMPVGPVSLTARANAQTPTAATPAVAADSGDTTSSRTQRDRRLVSYPVNEIFFALAAWSAWSGYQALHSRSSIRELSVAGKISAARLAFATPALAARSTNEERAVAIVEQILDPLAVYLGLIQESPIGGDFCGIACIGASMTSFSVFHNEPWGARPSDGIRFESPMSSNGSGNWTLQSDAKPAVNGLTESAAYSATPEPATVVLIATGLLAVGIMRRRRQSRG